MRIRKQPQKTLSGSRRPAGAHESRGTSRADGRPDVARADAELSLERSAHPLAAGEAALSGERLESERSAWVGCRRQYAPSASSPGALVAGRVDGSGVGHVYDETLAIG